MPAFLTPLSFISTSIAGWLNQYQQHAIYYLIEENRVLREQMGYRRLQFTDDQRRRLASRAKELSRKVLAKVATIVTPETLMTWHRRLIANKYDGSSHIQGAMMNVGHKLSAATIANILKRHGIEPAPLRKRKTTWKEFLSRHFDQIVATDFFTVEVWTKNGLQRFMVLFFIELSTRRAQLGGIAKCPNGFWMEQIARNITDCEDGFLKKNRFLIHVRDHLYTKQFVNLLDQSAIHLVKLPPSSPNFNAYAERFVRSIKDECLERMIFFGEDSLRRAVREYIAHYHAE